MKVIETSQDFSELTRKCNNSDIILIPILSDHSRHPRLSSIIGIYIFTLNNMQNYYISINHEEAVLNFDIVDVIDVLSNSKLKYVHDIKLFNHILSLDNVICCNSLSYFSNGNKIDVELTQAHNKLYSLYWNKSDVNKIVPIYKHIEYCENIKDKMLEVINNQVDEKDSKNMIKYLTNLNLIESSGLYTSLGYEYCNYNPYTTTGRPSNTFNKINYAALNKSDGSRNRYISRFENGAILELDYDAYHLRIIADMVGYKLPTTSIHEYLGKQYFGKDNLSDKEYSDAKQISFQILYGGIPEEFLSIPFFSMVNKFIYKFWQEWRLKNHYKTYLYNRKVKKSVIGEMNPQKLFNYYIQSAETELNSEAMKRVFEVLKNYNSKFILYTYDSFTFDFDMDDGKDLILQIKDAMKYPTRISVGSNYGDLKDVSLRFS